MINMQSFASERARYYKLQMMRHRMSSSEYKEAKKLYEFWNSRVN